MRQIGTAGKLFFVVLASTLAFTGSITSAGAYRLDVRNETPHLITYRANYVLNMPGKHIIHNVPVGETYYAQGETGYCWSSIRITSELYTSPTSNIHLIDQTFNIHRCGNLGLVVKPGLNGFTLEKYPF
jgi:hypothetical protein